MFTFTEHEDLASRLVLQDDGHALSGRGKLHGGKDRILLHLSIAVDSDRIRATGMNLVAVHTRAFDKGLFIGRRGGYVNGAVVSCLDLDTVVEDNVAEEAMEAVPLADKMLRQKFLIRSLKIKNNYFSLKEKRNNKKERTKGK